MKKTIIFMALLFTTSLYAQDCSLYELKGTVRVVKNDLHFMVAENTGSELDMIIPIMIQTDFSPYVNKFASGTFVVQGKSIKSNTRILATKKIDFAAHDPLAENQVTTFKKIKEVVCPKI